jgi:TRAP-type uncharacterized transport system fused permease subunit
LRGIWYVIKKEQRPAIKPGLKRFRRSARSGTENSLKIGATLGVIGIIIGVLTFTGLVLTFADIVIELAGGSLCSPFCLSPWPPWFSAWAFRSPRPT